MARGEGTVISRDIKGKRFGKLVAVSITGKDEKGKNIWHCKCDCGGCINIVDWKILYGYNKSCGCGKKTPIQNKKFGRLTALNYVKTRDDGHEEWDCICECGNTVRVLRNNLITKMTRSCGCLVTDTNLLDLTGKTFGDLTVIAHYGSVKGKAIWLCRCSCGNEVVFSSIELVHRNHTRCDTKYRSKLKHGA